MPICQGFEHGLCAMMWLPALILGAVAAVAVAAQQGQRRQRADSRRLSDVAGGGPFAHIAHRPGMAELAGSLAHELNQPLTAITSNAQAAREYLASGLADHGEIREILDDIVSDASRAGDIVRGVRALIRGEAPRAVPFEIVPVMARAVELARKDKASGVAIVQGICDSRLPRVVGDPMEIELVLFNLLTNALDAVGVAPPGVAHEVSVTARRQDDTIRVSVRDNGCGVADADLDAIFRPFYSSKPKGLGLGLSFSRALMARNGGRVVAIRNSDRGMTFECLLPIEPSARVPGETTSSIREAAICHS